LQYSTNDRILSDAFNLFGLPGFNFGLPVDRAESVRAGTTRWQRRSHSERKKPVTDLKALPWALTKFASRVTFGASGLTEKSPPAVLGPSSVTYVAHIETAKAAF
jgi:hypothetical protein